MVIANVAVRGNTVYNTILPGITSSRTRNPLEEWLFRRELPAQGLSHRRNGFPPGLTSSWSRNPPDEWNSAGNHQLMDDDNQNAKNKPDPTLKRTSYLSNEFIKGLPNLVRLSL
jgi:hypothetical protein